MDKIFIVYFIVALISLHFSICATDAEENEIKLRAATPP
jgi:hypothetical protein